MARYPARARRPRSDRAGRIPSATPGCSSKSRPTAASTCARSSSSAARGASPRSPARSRRGGCAGLRPPPRGASRDDERVRPPCIAGSQGVREPNPRGSAPSSGSTPARAARAVGGAGQAARRPRCPSQSNLLAAPPRPRAANASSSSRGRPGRGSIFRKRRAPGAIRLGVRKTPEASAPGARRGRHRPQTEGNRSHPARSSAVTRRRARMPATAAFPLGPRRDDGCDRSRRRRRLSTAAATSASTSAGHPAVRVVTGLGEQEFGRHFDRDDQHHSARRRRAPDQNDARGSRPLAPPSSQTHSGTRLRFEPRAPPPRAGAGAHLGGAR